jgi:tight adherence protein B
MHLLIVASVGAVTTWSSARAARRYAVADRLRTRPSRALVPPRARGVVAATLEAAAIDTPVAQALQTWAMAAVVGALLGLGLDGPATALVGILLVGCGGPVYVLARRHRRAQLITAAVPGGVDRVSAELRAGGTIATAITGLATSDGLLAPDFARLDARLRMGASLDDALHVWAEERRADGVEAMAGALAMCATVGGRGADALEALASSLRDRLAVVAEAQALSAQARLSALVVGGAPIAYLAWSVLVDPHALHALVATPVGQVCLAIGLTLELLGALWMRRIIRAGSVL